MWHLKTLTVVNPNRVDHNNTVDVVVRTVSVVWKQCVSQAELIVVL